MENVGSNVPDIFQFEKKFQEMIWQFQGVSEAFEILQKEHLQLRQELYSKESLLQSERRMANELRSRLKTAMETMNRSEEEKMRERIDHSNLSIDYESALKEREILTIEATSAQTEAVRLKIQVEALENTLRQASQREEKLEKALIELKNDNDRTTANIDVYIAKLMKEQKYLSDNCRTIILLNKRLQTFGLSFRAIDERYKIRIKDLQSKLIASTVNNLESLPADGQLHPEIENLCFKLREMLTELKSKVRNSVEIEIGLNQIMEKLSSIDNNN